MVNSCSLSSDGVLQWTGRNDLTRCCECDGKAEVWHVHPGEVTLSADCRRCWDRYVRSHRTESLEWESVTLEWARRWMTVARVHGE